MKQILPQDLANWVADPKRPKPVLLDVREPWELELCRLEGSLDIPMHLIPARLQEIDPDQEIVAICHHGGRSMQVALFLERNGYAGVYNLMGGVDGWACQVDPTMRRY